VTGRDDTYGPGVTWLAERADVPPAELLHDPVRLIQELGRATLEAAELAEDTEDLRARLTSGPSPGHRFGITVAQALRDQAERLRRDD
jgi:hypothetical protein